MRGIRGVTDSESVIPMQATIGRLHKGGPMREKKRDDGSIARYPGAELPYFRFESDRPEVMAAFKAAYGDKPTALNVILPFPTTAEVFQTTSEEWTAGGLTHRCDGVEMSLWRDAEGVFHVSPPAKPEPCPYYGHPEKRTKKNPGCKWVGRLYVIVLELLQANLPGLVSLVTTSKNDDLGLCAQLADIEEKRRLEGSDWPLYYMRCTLRRVPRMVSMPLEDGGRARQLKHMVEIEPVVTWVNQQIEAAQNEIAGLLDETHGPRQEPDWVDASTADQERQAREIIEAEFVEEKPGFAAAQEEPREEKPARPEVTEEQKAACSVLWQTGLAEARAAGWPNDGKSERAFLDTLGPVSLLDIIAKGQQDAFIAHCRDLGCEWHNEARITWLADLEKAVADMPGNEPPQKGPITKAAILFREIWPDLPDESIDNLRHQFLHIVHPQGVASLKQWGNGQLLMLNIRLAPEGPLDEVSAQYVRETLAYVNTENGQQPLFPAEEPAATEEAPEEEASNG
jgi:hypothetical protein